MTGKLIGNLHTISSIGSVMGTLITTFFIIPVSNINMVIVILTILLFITYLLYFIKNTPIHKILLFLPIPFMLFPLVPTEKMTKEEIYHHTSLYNDIHVYETKENGTVERYMTFGNKTTIQGYMNMNNTNRLLSTYTRNIYNAAHICSPRGDIFMIGHGIGVLTNKFEKENRNVKVAEIDPSVLNVSKKYFHYQGDSVIVGDGRKILQNDTSAYDVIILDAYRNTRHIPFHLITREFFSLTKEKMKQDGVLLINAIGKPSDDETIESLHSTLKDVYSCVYALGEHDENQHQNILFIASDHPIDTTKLKNLHTMNIHKGEIISDNDTKLKNLN